MEKRNHKYFEHEVDQSSMFIGELLTLVTKLAAEWQVDVTEINVVPQYSRGYYDDIDRSFEFTASREETDEEHAETLIRRKGQEAAKRAATRKAKATRERSERELYEKLKAKYDNA